MRKCINFMLLFCLLFLALGPITPQLEAAIISPPVIDEALSPGSKHEGSFSIFFTPEDPETLYLSVEKLEIEDITGNKKSSIPGRTEPTLANWVTLSVSEVHKAPDIKYLNNDNAVSIPYAIDIPFSAPPGGHYAVIIVSERSPSDQPGDTNIGIGADVTLQLIMEIEGEKIESALLNYFRIKNDQWLFSRLPVEFETLFVSTGNTHVIPRGNIEIMQGGSKTDNISLNPRQLRVFPRISRLYENIWSEEGIENMTRNEDILAAKNSLPNGSFVEELIYEVKNFRIGYYTANLQGFAGKKQFGGEVGFWVIPWHLLLVILLFILMAIGLLWAITSIHRLRRKLNGKANTKQST